ncbi:hypothetical protein HETIRDRAFT_45861, partial [Heterobasidion irregulare TC 32-1]
EESCYILDLPDTNNTFSIFHSSLLYPFHDSNHACFLSYYILCPGLIITINGIEEFEVGAIINKHY